MTFCRELRLSLSLSYLYLNSNILTQKVLREQLYEVLGYNYLFSGLERIIR